MAVDDSFTKVLLHMDGADASTTFTDESGKTWTTNGGAQIDTAQSVFGGASGYFDGNGDFITTPDHADFAFGSGDFTIDCRIRPAVINARMYVIAQINSAGLTSSQAFEIAIALGPGGAGNGRIRGGIYTESTGYYAGTNTLNTVAVNTWYHFALVRYGNTLTAYLDGTALGVTADVTGVTVNDPGQVETIGRWGNRDEYYYSGWLDEFRISKGIARWTGNFTPPASAYAPPLILSSAQCIII
jgi:hypothetical protein